MLRREFSAKTFTPTEVLRDIQRLESLKFAKSEMTTIKQKLMSMQKSLNQIYHVRVTKEKELERLEHLLNDMQFETGEDDFLQKTVQQREDELEETVQGLSNELYYQETLQYMLQLRRLNILALQKPINRLKRELTRTKQEVDTVKLHNRRARTASTFFEKAMEGFKQSAQEAHDLQSKALEEDVEHLKDRGRLDILLRKEQDFHRETSKQSLLSKRLKSMESDLDKLRGAC